MSDIPIFESGDQPVPAQVRLEGETVRLTQAQMTDDTNRHRRSLRLQGYDYAQAGAYFVTICTQGRECLFGQIVDGEMLLNDAGRMVQAEWEALPGRFTGIDVDAFIVMPNHAHGILLLNPVGAPFMAPHDPGADSPGAMNPGAMNRGAMNRAPTLGEIIRAFKAVATRRLRQSGLSEFAWQRNYYEHIIRNDESLTRIREYIANNPLQWALDRENPAHVDAGLAGAGLKPAPTSPWEGN